MLHRVTLRSLAVLLLTALVWAGCDEQEEWTAEGDVAPPDPEMAVAELPQEQEELWSRLQALCGQAFQGEVEEAPEEDESFANQELIMHVRQCTESSIHIPFHVGEDRSRTWIITRTDDGLRLKHDHRHEDGTEEEVTQYGGDTEDAGSPERQEFPADEHTADLIPEASTNVWGIEVRPDDEFVYTLRREGSDRHYRIRFDLTEPVDAPPAPWGYEDTEPTHTTG